MNGIHRAGMLIVGLAALAMITACGGGSCGGGGEEGPETVDVVVNVQIPSTQTNQLATGTAADVQSVGIEVRESPFATGAVVLAEAVSTFSESSPGSGNWMIPFRFPSGLANKHTLRLLNTFWYRWHGSRQQIGLCTPDWWFHPLDGIAHWHRVFGARGFTQYQCVIPSDADLCRQFLTRFQRGGGSSFVTVFKDCGRAGKGMLSFPKPGISLALDIPIQRKKTRRLIDDLNEFVIGTGGRVYLAKDAFTTPEHFRAMYPRLDEWNAIRHRWDPDGLLASAQSRRLLG